MEKVETLYTSINSVNKFDDYIRNVIFEDMEYTSDLLDPVINRSIKASLVKNMILSMKEDIILKPKNSTYTDNLLFSAIDSLASKIAVINEDGTINLAGHIFSDGNDLVAKIRNKFAHGDYIYSDDLSYIIFNFDGNNVPVSLDALINFAFDLFFKKIEYKKTNVFHKPIWVFSGIKRIPKYVKALVSNEELKGMLDLYYEYDFELKATQGSIPKEAYYLLDTFKDKMNKVEHNYRDYPFDVIIKNVQKEVDDCVDYFNKKSQKENWNVTISYTTARLTDEQKYKVIDTLNKIKGGNVTALTVASELPRYASRTINVNNNKDIYNPQMAIALNLLELMELYKSSDIKEVGPALADRIKSPINIDQDIYGMIQVLRLLEFSYMFENFDVNYEKLPLNGVKPSVCVRADSELEEAIRNIEIANNRIKEQDKYIEDTSKQLDNVMKKKMDEQKKAATLMNLGNRLIKMQEDKKLFQTSYDTYVDKANALFEDRRINNKYYTNRYIVERLRDSISHGNVYIIPNGEIVNTIIRFEDIYDDKLVFSLDIRLEELKRLLDECTNKLACQEVKIRNK